jgi:hypothetical protein
MRTRLSWGTLMFSLPPIEKKYCLLNFSKRIYLPLRLGRHFFLP